MRGETLQLESKQQGFLPAKPSYTIDGMYRNEKTPFFKETQVRTRSKIIMLHSRPFITFHPLLPIYCMGGVAWMKKMLTIKGEGLNVSVQKHKNLWEALSTHQQSQCPWAPKTINTLLQRTPVNCHPYIHYHFLNSTPNIPAMGNWSHTHTHIHQLIYAIIIALQMD